MVSSRPRPYFTPGKEPVPIVQEAGWKTGPVRTGGKYRPTGIQFPDRPAPSSVAIPTELPGPLRYTGVIEKILFTYNVHQNHDFPPNNLEHP